MRIASVYDNIMQERIDNTVRMLNFTEMKINYKFKGFDSIRKEEQGRARQRFHKAVGIKKGV